MQINIPSPKSERLSSAMGIPLDRADQIINHIISTHDFCKLRNASTIEDKFELIEELNINGLDMRSLEEWTFMVMSFMLMVQNEGETTNMLQHMQKNN